MNKVDWWEKCHNEEKFPWLVVFDNRRIFPASDRFQTKREAEKTLENRSGILFETKNHKIRKI